MVKKLKKTIRKTEQKPKKKKKIDYRLRRELIIESLAKGVSKSETARLHGCAPNYITQLLKQEGVQETIDARHKEIILNRKISNNEYIKNEQEVLLRMAIRSAELLEMAVEDNFKDADKEMTKTIKGKTIKESPVKKIEVALKMFQAVRGVLKDQGIISEEDLKEPARLSDDDLQLLEDFKNGG